MSGRFSLALAEQGGDRAQPDHIDSPREPSRGEFTATKGRHRARPWCCFGRNREALSGSQMRSLCLGTQAAGGDQEAAERRSRNRVIRATLGRGAGRVLCHGRMRPRAEPSRDCLRAAAGVRPAEAGRLPCDDRSAACERSRDRSSRGGVPARRDARYDGVSVRVARAPSATCSRQRSRQASQSRAPPPARPWSRTAARRCG